MTRTHAFCKASIAPVRSEASDCSEIVTQLLFGEVVELIEQQNQWLKIRSFMDGYEGWIDLKHVHELREKEVSRWLDGLVTEHSLHRIMEGPEGMQHLTAGSFRPATTDEGFHIGKAEYRFVNEEMPFPTTICTYAQEFLNAPYLWGGKTLYGIDCSGFMQLIHRVFDYQLPRDAYQQEELGQTIEFEDRQAGDLAFFISDSGKIHHVGLLLSANEIIHAHGYVRMDDFTDSGIIRRLDGVLSHRFHSIKRL